MMTDGQNILKNIEKLNAMKYFNSTNYKSSVRAPGIKRLLSQVKVDGFTNAQVKKILINNAISQSFLEASTVDNTYDVPAYYRDTFFESIEANVRKMFKNSYSICLDAKVDNSVLAAKSGKKQKIEIKPKVFLEQMISDTNKAQSLSKSIKEATSNNAAVVEADRFIKKNTNILQPSKKSLKQKIANIAKKTAIAATLVCATVFGLKKQTNNDKDTLPTKNTHKTEVQWQKVAVDTIKSNTQDSIKNIAANKASQSQKISQDKQYDPKLVDDSKRILSQWVKKENLNKVITGLVSQGLSSDQAYRYAHQAALCGSKTTDNIQIIDSNGNKKHSNGNHTLWGEKALKEAGGVVTSHQRNILAKSVDFKTGRVRVGKTSLKAFNSLDKYLVSGGKLNIQSYSRLFAQNSR